MKESKVDSGNDADESALTPIHLRLTPDSSSEVINDQLNDTSNGDDDDDTYFFI